MGRWVPWRCPFPISFQLHNQATLHLVASVVAQVLRACSLTPAESGRAFLLRPTQLRCFQFLLKPSAAGAWRQAIEAGSRLFRAGPAAVIEREAFWRRADDGHRRAVLDELADGEGPNAVAVRSSPPLGSLRSVAGLAP